MASQVARQSDAAFFKPARTFPARTPNGFPVGKRTEERAKQNKELNKLPDSVKRHCEVKLPGICVRDRMLTWCHATKSRFLLNNRDWQTACRGCLPCHQAIENMSHAEMARIVKEAIAKRKP